MQLVFVSDLHADARTAGYDRHEDVETALDQAVRRAIDLDATLVCLGDLCDPDSPNLIRCICMAQRAARRVRRSIWVAGNHDVLEDGHGTTTLDPIFAEVMTRPKIVRLDAKKRAIFLPYTASGFSYDPEASLREFRKQIDEGGTVVVIGIHLMLEGISIGSETEDFPRGRDVFFPIDLARELFPEAILVAGHYHEPQIFRGVHVVGSLCRLTRSEVGNNPRYLVIDV